ncbi:XRE family transcriptional regulator [Streptomyces sp. AV19]|uniref:XRE family transcriptional regulator n=1 Tax=Streptomyces sp. AV19 TaxID=2793068 RepID=UPI0018FEF7A6|nr:XRE family transcriptional regulator [Streptomyces sp. AV19]MBH1936638.1 XRE family transcriptional regulator [Streptomyces sp. AV19]MDG4532699.1 XRE family transcriptional regulator [Streptomyces sp. AV19]
MADKKLSARQLATRIGVTAKTVERWITDEELVPHARNRVDASSVLGVDEAVLWPKAVGAVMKTGPDREIISAYPYRSACPSSVWRQLIGDSTRDIVLAGYTNYFFWIEQPAFHATLRAKAEAGCRVRFLLGDPGSRVTEQREIIEDVALKVSTRIRISLEELAKLSDLSGLEVRFSSEEDATNHVGLSVFRFDDQALVTPHLARLVGHDSPMLHLRKLQDGGLFDRFAEHTEELWEHGRPIG